MLHLFKEQNESNFTKCIVFQQVHSFSATSASHHLTQAFVFVSFLIHAAIAG